jgi:DNA-binding transcriptional LysR family regulator
MLNVSRLRVLREVAQYGSLTGAAEALSFSQPAISNQIAKLEQETGTRLIERGPRGVRLTGAGELLVRHADSILSRLDQAQAELEEHLEVRRGRLRLGAFPTAYVDLVSRALATFKSAHPRVEVSLEEVRLETAVDRLEDGRLDLALVFQYDIAAAEPAFDDRTCMHLLDDLMYLVVNREHPLARRPEIVLTDLRDEPWLEYTQGGAASRVLHHAFHAVGIDPRVILEIDDLLAIQGLVVAGVGHTFVPGMALPALRPELVVRSLGEQLPTRRVYALWPGSGLSPAAAAMADLLQAAARPVQDQVREGAGLHPARRGER